MGTVSYKWFQVSRLGGQRSRVATFILAGLGIGSTLCCATRTCDEKRHSPDLWGKTG
ncbi:hypothetical protein BH09ACT4_BH09ACT4_11770 [soil metagenome]